MVKLFRQNKLSGALLQPGQERFGGLGVRAGKEGLAGADDPDIGALLVKACRRATFSCSTWRNTIRHEGQGRHHHFGDLTTCTSSRDFHAGNLIPVIRVAMAGRYLGQKIVTMT